MTRRIFPRLHARETSATRDFSYAIGAQTPSTRSCFRSASIAGKTPRLFSIVARDFLSLLWDVDNARFYTLLAYRIQCPALRSSLVICTAYSSLFSSSTVLAARTERDSLLLLFFCRFSLLFFYSFLFTSSLFSAFFNASFPFTLPPRWRISWISLCLINSCEIGVTIVSWRRDVSLFYHRAICRIFRGLVVFGVGRREKRKELAWTNMDQNGVRFRGLPRGRARSRGAPMLRHKSFSLDRPI